MMPENSLVQNQELSIPFCAMDIPELLKLGIQELGYVSPTQFQKGIFDHFKKGQNVACRGESNYGKSLAYNLPILAKVDPSTPTLQALIICDSTTQADIATKECRALSRHMGLNIGSAIKSTQILICSASSAETNKANIESILKEQGLRTIFLDNLSTLNAHRIINILSTALSDGEVQILIFGNETINAIKDQAQEVLDSVAFVNNNDQPKITVATKHTAHVASETEPKPRALLAALELYQPKGALITCNEANECDLLARFLSRYGFRTLICSEENNTHGLSTALVELSRHNIDALICQNNMLSSVSLENIAFMINYDMIERPQVYEQTTQFNKQAPNVERHIVNLLSSRELGYLGPIKAQCLIDILLSDLPSSEEVVSLSAKRVLAQLSAEASLVELAQFESLAQQILIAPEALSILALLLRNHFLKAAPPITTSSAPRRNDRGERGERGERPERYERHDRRERAHRDRPLPHHEARPARSSQTQAHPQASDRHIEQHIDSLEEHDVKAAPSVRPAPEGSTRLYVTLGRQDNLADLASLAQFLSDRSGVDLGHFSGTGMVRDRSAHIEVDDEVAQAIIDAMHNTERPHLGGESAETSTIVCERARQATERPHRRPPMRRGPNFQRRR